LHRGGSSVQHFLSGERHALGDLTHRVHDLDSELANCAVLTNSDLSRGGDAADSLEETENRLMAEWLFDRTRPDPRFFLREALHESGIHRDYRYVLLDCPPRLTTACVNALAASDFVLIPVVPDAVSTRAVENLLRTLKQFRDTVLPELAILGVVPNMVRLLNEKPIQSHAAAIDDLKSLLPAVWDDPILVAKSVIKHDSKFGQLAAEMDASGKLKLAIANKEIQETFRSLAKELEKEMDRHASRHSPVVSAKSGARARSSR
jgi:cellulose biosynthesis protein BcsQ